MAWIKIAIRFSMLLSMAVIASCGIYTFTGASVDGKTINVAFIENNAAIIAPTLSNVLTQTVRNKILNQTSLSQVNNDNADYLLKGNITRYDVSLASIQNTQSVASNRLNITVEFQFTNNKDIKKNFTRSYTKFADFDGTQTLQQAQDVLIAQISKELADVVFNDAFVSW